MKTKRKYILPVKKTAIIRIVKRNKISHFGIAKQAIDFAVPEGTSIYAARAGVVTEAKDDSKLGGMDKKYVTFANFVQIMHDDNTVADYLHLKYKGAKVKVGQRVKQGQTIGYSGNTGWSSEPHLHFMVWKVQSINVCKYLFPVKRK